MWLAELRISLYLLSLILSIQWSVNGERQFRLKETKDQSVGPKVKIRDKMPPCVHDEVLYM